MRIHRQRRGVALVELAIVLPVIMLLFVVFMEVSRVVMLQHTADTSAYEGARVAIIPEATSKEAELAACDVLEANRLDNFTVSVVPSKIEHSTATVTVAVEIPIAGNSWISPFFSRDMVVRQEVTLLTERPTAVKLTGLPDLKRLKKIDAK